MLVGISTGDDAGVYRVRDDLAIVSTVDFFTPVVDDPYTYGQIAAANAMSDVYAMGGRPITALNLVCWPQSGLPREMLNDILRGGSDKAKEAGAVIVGGHSVADEEVKYGMAVTGVIDPRRIVRNVGALAGDALVLTKPLGTGVLMTAFKRDCLAPEYYDSAVATMMQLNARAAEVMRRARGMIRRDRREQEPVMLEEIVTAVSRLVASDLIINHVTLVPQLQDVPSLSADRIQLQQVVLNLLLNAIDAVRSQPRNLRQVTVSIWQEVPGRVELAVSDTGPGLREDVAARVFEPFTTTKPGGMGLGLTVVRAIVEAHGGRVFVESSSEGGAAFRVSLPCDYSRGSDAARSAAVAASVASGDRR